MPLYTHVESGLCEDLQPGADEDEYFLRFPKVDTKLWEVKEVPPDTQPFAKWNGDNNKPTNPATPKPSPAAPATTKQQILDQIVVLQGLANQLP